MNKSTSTGNLSHLQSTTKNHEIYNLKTGYFRGFMINNNVPGSYTIDLINLLPQFVKKNYFLQYQSCHFAKISTQDNVICTTTLIIKVKLPSTGFSILFPTIYTFYLQNIKLQIHKFLLLVTYNLQLLNPKRRPTNLQLFHFQSCRFYNPKQPKSTAYNYMSTPS